MGKRLTLREKVLRQVTDQHTDEEIEDAARALRDELRARRGQARVAALYEFRAGDHVVLNKPAAIGRLPHGSRGTVVRRLQKNLLVDFGPRGEWRVPGTLLKKGGAGAPTKTNGKAMTR